MNFANFALVYAVLSSITRTEALLHTSSDTLHSSRCRASIYRPVSRIFDQKDTLVPMRSFGSIYHYSSRSSTSIFSTTNNKPSAETKNNNATNRKRKPQQRRNSNVSSKQRGTNTPKRSSYTKWLQETYNWIQSAPTPLPFEICQNAHDLIRGWVKVAPIGTASNAQIRWDNANKTDYLLRRFIEEKEADNVYAEYLPNASMFRLAIEAWAACAHAKDDLVPAKNAHALLDLMTEHSEQYEHLSDPSIACHNAVINAYALSGTAEGIEKANKHILMMENIFESSVEEHRSKASDETITSESSAEEVVQDFQIIKPTTVLYNTVFNAIVKLPGPPNVDLALSLLNRMEHQFLELGNKYAQPTSYSYTSVMSLFTTNRRALEGQEILLQMEKMHEASKIEKLKPDTITYNTVMACWANSGSPEAGKRAQDILDRMSAPPNRKSYNAVLLAHAKSGDPSKAQETLNKMHEHWEQYGDEEMKPDVRTYTTVMNAWGRSSLPDAPEKAYEILKKMNETYEVTKDKSIKPNKFSYTAVLDAFAYSSLKNGAMRAEELLNEMKMKAEEDSDLKPDVRSYNAVLNAYSRSGLPDAGIKADKILTEMEDTSDLNPDAFSYNSAILAYVREHSVESSKKSLELLKRMENGYKSGNKTAKPISNNYNSVISCLATNSNPANPELAEEVTNLLKTLQTTEGLRADRFCYSAALYAWSRSCDVDKGPNAFSILKEMSNAGIKPDVLNYVTVMNACAHTLIPEDGDHDEKLQKQSEVFNVAKSAFKQLQADKGLQIDEGAYTVFLRCCRMLLPRRKENEQDDTNSLSTRSKIIIALFKKVCEDGLVSERVVGEFMSRGEIDLFNKLLGEYSANTAEAVWKKIPENWKCNVGKIKQKDWKGNIMND